MAMRSDGLADYGPAAAPTLVSAAAHEANPSCSSADFARSVGRLLHPLLLAFLVVGFIVAVDPYYVFGSPSWTGFNLVRPLYESEEWIAKPHQVRRLHPSAVVLGSSSAEAAIDPRHGGWASGPVFNFALPGGPSYALTLGFLHAQRMGTPLKQAVVGLDFFGFNANIPLTLYLNEQAYGADIAAFAQFLEQSRRGKKQLHEVMPDASPGPLPASAPPLGPGIESDEFLSEEFYLAVNPDVAAAVLRKNFRSGGSIGSLSGAPSAAKRQGFHLTGTSANTSPRMPTSLPRCVGARS